MPIRFRCVYCDQLLGIAHRKAGTVVKCPNCAGQLVVPNPNSDDDSGGSDAPTAQADTAGRRQNTIVEKEKTAPAPASEPGMLFERNDFDELLKPALEKKEPAVSVKSAKASRSATVAPVHVPTPAAQTFDFNASVPVVEPAPVYTPAYAPSSSDSAPRRSGILLTPLKLILLALFVMGGMASAFAGGMLLGFYLGRS